MKKHLYFILLFVCLAAVSFAETNTSKPPLFKIQDENRTVYILGSIHLDNGSLLPLHETVMAAWESCETLVVEVALPENQMETAAAINPYILLPEGKTLDDLMTEEDLKELQTALNAMGLPYGLVKKWNPWFLDLSIFGIEIMNAGFTENGIDMFFLKSARNQKKTVIGLETIEFQIKLFASTPVDVQIASLLQTMRERAAFAEQTSLMLEAYRIGDLDSLGNMMEESFEDSDDNYAEEFMDKMLTSRNKNWVNQLAELINSGRSLFIVVGSGHLTGKDNLIVLLLKEGFIFDRVH